MWVCMCGCMGVYPCMCGCVQVCMFVCTCRCAFVRVLLTDNALQCLQWDIVKCVLQVVVKICSY